MIQKREKIGWHDLSAAEEAGAEMEDKNVVNMGNERVEAPGNDAAAAQGPDVSDFVEDEQDERVRQVIEVVDRLGVDSAAPPQWRPYCCRVCDLKFLLHFLQAVTWKTWCVGAAREIAARPSTNFLFMTVNGDPLDLSVSQVPTAAPGAFA